MTKKVIQLPSADLSFDYPLMKAIENRRTVRKWSKEPITIQELADILFVACGITKVQNGKLKSKRTVPSACNSQEIRVYVLLEEGAFLYDEANHILIDQVQEDLRPYVGTQKMMHKAPIGLVLTADFSRMNSSLLKTEEIKQSMAWADTGFVSQNV